MLQLYLIIREDVYLLPPGPTLVTFPDICITKPSDKGSTSLWGVVLIKCVENLSQLHSSPINKIYNKIQIIHQSWRVLTAGTSRRNIVNTLLPIVSLQPEKRVNLYQDSPVEFTGMWRNLNITVFVYCIISILSF